MFHFIGVLLVIFFTLSTINVFTYPKIWSQVEVIFYTLMFTPFTFMTGKAFVDPRWFMTNKYYSILYPVSMCGVGAGIFYMFLSQIHWIW